MSNSKLDLEDDDEILEPARILNVEVNACDEEAANCSLNYVSIEMNNGYVYHFDAHKIADLAEFAKHM